VTKPCQKFHEPGEALRCPTCCAAISAKIVEVLHDIEDAREARERRIAAAQWALLEPLQ